MTRVQCSNCDQPAAVAARTAGRDSVRGLNTTIYYEPESAPRGSDPLCAAHAESLVTDLIRVLS